MNPFLEDLLDYIELGERDRALLVELHPQLEPSFSAIAERFYAAVWAHPKAAAVLRGPEQVERLRVTLIDWMSTGLLGPYDDRFYDKRSRIGRRHVQIGLAHEYMFTAMNVVRTAYHDQISTLYADGAAGPVIRAVNKLLDLELTIMVRHYHLDSDEKLIARERRMQADRISAMQTMTAGLAHEVRNPLNSAKLQLALLERRLRRIGDDPKLIEPSELAQKEIERLTELLNDFLAFARPPSLHVQDADIAELIGHLCDLERITAEQKGVNLSVAPGPERLLVRADAPKIHQLLLNLIRNAIEAVSTDGNVVIALSYDDDAFTVRIQDDGPGIPEESRDRIFEPFFSTKEGGTGLGMSIVHSLVSLHGGAITVDTGAGGTTFSVTLPRRQ